MNTKNRLKVAIAALLMLGMTTSNAMAASEIGTADVRIAERITIDKKDDLSFGGMLQSGSGGTITVSAEDGTLTSSGVQTLTPSTGSRGRFFVNGQQNRTYNTTLDSTVTLIGPPTSNSMTASLTSDNNGVFGIFGCDNVFIGGTLDVGVDQAPGLYTGTFNIAMDF